jgi:phenol hydroxylase P2 protein
MPDSVFIAFQTNDDSRPIIEAIEADNPHAVVNAFPAMVKIDAVGRLVIRRESIEVQLNLISLGGNIDETDDEFILEWKA